MIAGAITAAATALTIGIAVKAAGGLVAIGNTVKNVATGSKTVATAGGIINAADTASDIGSMISNQRTVKQMQALSEGMRKGSSTIKQFDDQLGQSIPLVQEEKTGFLEGLVSMVTERTYAKPQRQKMINDYIVFHLQPDFKQRIEMISQNVVSSIQSQLLSESQGTIDQIRSDLEQLKAQKLDAKAAYQQKIAEMESYKQFLAIGLHQNNQIYLPQ
jgi:hypothetical protein